jgi:hypothetical protein
MLKNILEWKYNDEISIYENIKNEIWEYKKNENLVYSGIKCITTPIIDKDNSFDNKMVKNCFSIRLKDGEKIKIGLEIESKKFWKLKIIKTQNIYNLKWEKIYKFGLCIQE